MSGICSLPVCQFASLPVCQFASLPVCQFASLPEKETHFDLPIALGLLHSIGYMPNFAHQDIMAAGELSLDGTLLDVKGALSIADLARKENRKTHIATEH